MTVVRTFAAHELVRATFPKPETPARELGLAVGRAIDATLSAYSHEASQGRRPTAASVRRRATEVLAEELRDAGLELAPPERARAEAQAEATVAAFRKSELFGLPRPRSRLVLVNERVGFYAQPDFWDGRGRFYEMKSYRAVPPPLDVEMQLGLFQLAFAPLAGVLVCLDRHVAPVETSRYEVPPLSEGRKLELLGSAYRFGLKHGAEKVLEYIDSPTVRYTIPDPAEGEEPLRDRGEGASPQSG